MTRVRLTDITLRENAKAEENTLSFKEMIEISKILDRLHLDTITLAPIVNVKVDSLLVRIIASAVKNSTLSIPVGFSLESVDDAWNAVCNAVNPRLCVEIPVSIVQMEFVCRQKPADGLRGDGEMPGQFVDAHIAAFAHEFENVLLSGRQAHGASLFAVVAEACPSLTFD